MATRYWSASGSSARSPGPWSSAAREENGGTVDDTQAVEVGGTDEVSVRLTADGALIEVPRPRAATPAS